MNQSKLQPVLFGGLFIGVLSALPIINFANCCCLWIVGGGALSAWLLQRDRFDPLPAGEGALGGLLAGVAGAVVYVAVYIPINIVTAPLQRGMMEFVLDSGADVPPEVREVIENFGAFESIAFGAMAGFGLMLVGGMVFSTLGGLFGALVFRPSPPPPGSSAPVPPLPAAPPSSAPPPPPAAPPSSAPPPPPAAPEA